MIRPFEVVGIGASLGGIEALRTVLSGLPLDFAASVIVVQHRSSRYPSQLNLILGMSCALPVVEATDGVRLEAGKVYVAPAGRHLTVDERARLRLSALDAAKVQFTRPAIDPLFVSIAEHFRQRAIGVVLTGKQRDGAVGARQIKQHGGRVLVQDPRTARAAGMPSATLAATPVDHVLPVDTIAQVLTTLVMVRGAASFFLTGPHAAPLSAAIPA